MKLHQIKIICERTKNFYVDELKRKVIIEAKYN